VNTHSLNELEELTLAQFNMYLEGFFEEYKNEWEQTRLIMWSIIQPNSKKKLKPTEIISFDWDKDNKVSEPLDKEKKQEILLKMKEMERKMNVPRETNNNNI